METDFSPQREENTSSVFAIIGLSDPDTVTLYTDITVPFSFTSNRLTQCILILYVYDTDAILVEPIKIKSDADILCAYDVVYDA